MPQVTEEIVKGQVINGGGWADKAEIAPPRKTPYLCQLGELLTPKERVILIAGLRRSAPTTSGSDIAKTHALPWRSFEHVLLSKVLNTRRVRSWVWQQGVYEEYKAAGGMSPGEIFAYFSGGKVSLAVLQRRWQKAHPKPNIAFDGNGTPITDEHSTTQVEH